MKKILLTIFVVTILMLGGCEQTSGPGNIKNNEELLPIEAPVAPEKPELVAGDTLLGVTWRKVTGAETYRVRYGDTVIFDKSIEWTGEQTEEAETVSTLITGLENDERYYVWVSASNSAGESGYSERAYAKPAAIPFDIPPLFFDYGRMISSIDDPAAVGAYTVPQGRTLVLTPVKYNIGNGAVFTWEVDDEQQSGQGTGGEYFSFNPPAQGEYTVKVSVTDGTLNASAVTKVHCVASEGTHKRAKTASSVAKALDCFGFMPAPGQFVGALPPINFGSNATAESVTNAAQTVVTNAGVTWRFSLGSFGGYLVTGFDHSVDNVDGEYSFSIKGNAFGAWEEPAVVWVSQDENGNGQADDTWYELKGSQTGQAGTIQRYAVTWFKPQGGTSGIWKDNQGNTGTYPKGFPYLKNTDYFTLVGTRIESGSDGWGYVDIGGPERFRISDAIQVDGTPANLAYIDFVKVQCGSHEMAGISGEISTETGVPFDLSIPNPALLVQGADAGGGKYTYRFVNSSGYSLTVTVEGQTFQLGSGGGDKTVTLDKPKVYFDYYGGNVTYTRTTGLVTFSM
jgi:hypothetical protein